MERNRTPAQKHAESHSTTTTKIMARHDKSARIDAAVAAIQRGEFTDYTNAAKKYECSHTADSRHVWGLTKSQKEANSF